MSFRNCAFFVALALLLAKFPHTRAQSVFEQLDIAEPLAKLLLLQPEWHETTTGIESLSSMATNYYGHPAFAVLLSAANILSATDGFYNSNSTLKSGLKLRFPSILQCPQFLSVDCVLISFRKSIELSPDTPNYWHFLGADTYDKVAEQMQYPNYISFIMDYLSNERMNPRLGLEFLIVNNLDGDLREGKVNMKIGSSQNPPAVISSFSIARHTITLGDIMQGIHGVLSYRISNFDGNSYPLDFTFHIYAGNGTIKNTLKVNNKTLIVDGAYQEISIYTNVRALISLTRSPQAEIKIVLTPSYEMPNLADTTHLLTPAIDYELTLDGTFQSKVGDFLLATNSSNRFPFPGPQGWRLIPFKRGLTFSNLFRIINDNSSLAIQADVATGRLLLAPPNEENLNQLWKVIPLPTGTLMYSIRAPTRNLCWHVSMTSLLKPFVDPLWHEITLENCEVTSQSQKWYIGAPEYFIRNGIYSLKASKSQYSQEFIFKRVSVRGVIDQYAFVIVDPRLGHALTAKDPNTQILTSLSPITDPEHKRQLWTIVTVNTDTQVKYKLQSVYYPGSNLCSTGTFPLQLKSTVSLTDDCHFILNFLRPIPSVVYESKAMIRKSTSFTNVLDLIDNGPAKGHIENGQNWQKFKFLPLKCSNGEPAWHVYTLNNWALASNGPSFTKGEWNMIDPDRYDHIKWIIEPDDNYHGIYHTFRNCLHNSYLLSPFTDTPGYHYILASAKSLGTAQMIHFI